MGCMAVGRGLRHLRMALWDDGGVRAVRGAGISPAAAGGCFAGCGQRVFRPVRGAGVSPAAAGDRGRCPLDPCDFLKKIE